MDKKAGGWIAIAAVPVVVFTTAFSILLFGSAASATCNPESGPSSSVSIDPKAVPDTTISGYGHEQLVNAAYIIQAGKDLGLSVRDQTIGVMTSMGESSLIVLDRGDSAGPDSRGLFQQRGNGAWGSYDDRMNPYISSTNFFKKLATIEDRDSLAPTIVAHRVQVNADPYHYEKFWDSAVAVVEGLSGIDTGLQGGNGNKVCSNGALLPGEVSASGWAMPGTGPITDPFGMRLHPTEGVWRLHRGTDLQAGGCDGPIWAAQDGVVSRVGFDSAGNGTITVDHGGGVQTSYLHMYGSGFLVRAGDKVEAGQQIARTGSSGQSTGCHLHFVVNINGNAVDPVPFMAEVGVKLG
ncbi:M23 family metallopeptidase [Agromyces sp. SYSU K20354]|uniref:M23 family metallopeptidase n=1 Tax=Agromyces cavernae TaxID=2898659 RepID=UPI001E4432E7|nr:M23 family metallopeptidase [Agromyces cavernae]MCD2444331.1 M23 family metallopeptidase [Agromyces cavernae]